MKPDTYNSFLFYAEDWLKESIFQSKLLIDSVPNLNSLNNIEDHTKFNQYIKDHTKFSQRRFFTEHYLLTATVMARRFLTKIAHHVTKFEREAINKYLAETEIAETIRDMREHSDEYFAGKGRKPELFHESKPDGSMAWDLSCSFIEEDGYYLGNKITVQSIIEIAEKLLINLPKKKKIDIPNLSPPQSLGQQLLKN